MATFNEPNDPIKDVVFMGLDWSVAEPLSPGIVLAFDVLGTRDVIRVRLDWEEALQLSREVLDLIEDRNPYDHEVPTDDPQDQ